MNILPLLTTSPGSSLTTMPPSQTCWQLRLAEPRSIRGSSFPGAAARSRLAPGVVIGGPLALRPCLAMAPYTVLKAATMELNPDFQMPEPARLIASIAFLAPTRCVPASAHQEHRCRVAGASPSGSTSTSLPGAGSLRSHQRRPRRRSPLRRRAIWAAALPTPAGSAASQSPTTSPRPRCCHEKSMRLGLTRGTAQLICYRKNFACSNT
jgi:hypothetical protein